MNERSKRNRTFRWALSVLLVATGLSITWAWGQVARLADRPAAEAEPQPLALYAAWQPLDSSQRVLFRSLDGGATWQPLTLPGDAVPLLWADDGDQRVAVAAADGALFRSSDRGQSWTSNAVKLVVTSLAWNEGGTLFVGTAAQGVYGLSAALEPQGLAPLPAEGEVAAVEHLAPSGDRLYAATAGGLYYSDDEGQSWAVASLPSRVSGLVALDREILLAGTMAGGLFRSADAGRTWQAISAGLAQAAGLYLDVTSLIADPLEPGVAYAAIGYRVGGTELHASAGGALVTTDGGLSWLPLAGPAFPEARPASGVVVVPGKPLYAHLVTAAGLQAYEPDLAAALTLLANREGTTAPERVNAARLLGLAGSRTAGEALVAALADPDPAVSLVAADALGRIADPATVGGLLVALDFPTESVRLSAARALGRMRVEAAVEPLRRLLMQDTGSSVWVAADALGRIGSRSASDALLAALADADLSPRRHAAQAALEAMGESAVAPLAGMVADGDEAGRRNAAEAMGWIGSPSATGTLVEALRDRSPLVRGQAAWALGEIGDGSARRALERAGRRDPDQAVREAATLALAGLRGSTGSGRAWTEAWAPTLSRFEAARWLVLGLSLLGAAWVVGPQWVRPVMAHLRALNR